MTIIDNIAVSTVQLTIGIIKFNKTCRVTLKHIWIMIYLLQAITSNYN